MGITDDICEPRYKFAKSKAQETFNFIPNNDLPVDLESLATALGIILNPADITIDGLSRVDSNGTCLIVYSVAISDLRRRFTIAHELGHILLEHISIGGDSSQISKGSQEKEANCFAGELLIPAKDIKKYFKENPNVTIDDIQKRYLVSKEAAFVAINGNRLLNKLSC